MGYETASFVIRETPEHRTDIFVLTMIARQTQILETIDKPIDFTCLPSLLIHCLYSKIYP